MEHGVADRSIPKLGPEDLRSGWTWLVLYIALAIPLPVGADPPNGTPDDWTDRILQSLGASSPLYARGEVQTSVPGSGNTNFSIEMLRLPIGDRVHTLFELRQDGTAASVVNRLVSEGTGPLKNWVWDVVYQRFRPISGIQTTDRFAGTSFHYEDLGLADPEGRRSGGVRRVEQDGRTLVELESQPYHYYSRVVTTVDPDTGLPSRVVFFDQTGAPIREQRFEQVRDWGGRRYPSVVTMLNLVTREQSILSLQSVRFDVSPRASAFDLVDLDGRLRRGVDVVPAPRTAGGTP